MRGSDLATDPAVAAYIAALRTALERFVIHVQFVRRFPQLGCDTQEAEQLLAMETGREAQEDLALQEDLASEAYILADYAHYQLFGVPRSLSGYVPTDTEVRKSLEQIASLTNKAQARFEQLATHTEGTCP